MINMVIMIVLFCLQILFFGFFYHLNLDLTGKGGALKLIVWRGVMKWM